MLRKYFVAAERHTKPDSAAGVFQNAFQVLQSVHRQALEAAIADPERT